MEDDDYPCVNCINKCDAWEAEYCCLLCEHLGGGNCDDCDPWEI